MRSDEIKMPRLELFEEDMGKGVRLFAYSSAISEKERSAASVSGDTAKAGSVYSGLNKELGYSRLDACDNA